MDKKQKQLGINPSTASHKLLKDILFYYIMKEGHVCYQCKGELLRNNFSIEHKTPWLDSENPIELFFSLENIAYSHLNCNCSAARKKISQAEHNTNAKYQSGCRCSLCKTAHAKQRRSTYTKEARRIKYEKEKLK